MKNKLESIQIMRAVAAALVIFNHMTDSIALYSPSPSYIHTFAYLGAWGASGVDIFFVISGFIMYYITAAKPGGSDAAREFMAHRIIRIYPLYILFCGALLALYFAGIALRSNTYTLPYLLASFTLFPVMGDTPPLDRPNIDVFFTPGWTLVFEMYFYIAFAVSIIALKKRWRLPILYSLFAGAALAAQFLPESGVRQLVTSPLIIEFLFGICAGWITLRYRETLLAYAWSIITAGFILLTATIFIDVSYTNKVFVWGPCAFLVVFGAANLNLKNTLPVKILKYLGDASYSTYCSHFYFMLLLSALLKRDHLTHIQPDVLIVLSTLISLAGGAVVYTIIEKPLLGAIKRGRTQATGAARPSII